MANVYDAPLEIATAVSREGELFRFTHDGVLAASCAFEGGRVTFAIRYDFREEPLTLTGVARAGDAVVLRLLPQRIELRVNGRVADEEWPCGRHALEEADCVAAVPCETRRVAPIEGATPPQIVGTFEGAEGWQPEESVFVGDCMPYVNDGRYHVLYLKDRHHHGSKWGLGAHQWEHISTADFSTWQIHPMAVAIDAPEEASICTGSWIRQGGRQLLFYTVRTCDGSPASIRRSVSEDGYHFQKDPEFDVKLSERYTGASARDPKVILDADGLFHMLLTTSLRRERRGCLAHLVSPDLNTWREESEPLYVSPTSDEPECCDYFYFNGWYYLVFSLRSYGQYLYSREPFSGWRMPADPSIPCKSVPKAAIWRDRIIFTGFDGHGHYAGTMTFTEAQSDSNGELRFTAPKPTFME